MVILLRISLCLFLLSSVLFAAPSKPWVCTFRWDGACHDVEVAIEYNSQVIFDNFNYSVPEVDVALYVYRRESLSSYGISDSWANSHLVDYSSVFLLRDSSNITIHSVFESNIRSYDIPAQIKSGETKIRKEQRNRFVRGRSVSRQSNSVFNE